MVLKYLLSAGAIVALAAGCAGGHQGSAVPTVPQSAGAAGTRSAQAAGSNAVANPGFETGSLSSWTSCGTTSKAVISTAQQHSGSHSALIGTTAKPEVNGTAGLCQTITVPSSATLTFWVYEGTNDTISYVDQEADVLSTSGTKLAQLYAEAKSTGGWVQKTFSLSAYAGQTIQLYFGVKGNGYASGYVYEYLDDVSVAGTATPTPAPTPTSAPTATPTGPPGGGVVNAGFETGSLSPWTSCGTVSKAAVSTAQKHSGSYSALIGTTAKPEVNGTAGVCQTITVPSSATLTFWVYEGTNDTISYVDQEADVLSTSGAKLSQLYAEAKSTGGWVQKSFSLSGYAGQTVQLYFGVKGNGYASGYVYEYLDDVSISGSGGTPTPAPTPTSAPTATPTGGPFACDNQQFLTDQSEFAAGTITADQFVDVCGSVTQVLPKKTTTSGTHGYFYVEMPSGYQIEIVSNLDAMAEAPSDNPPTTWPWVAVGNYVYVQGRYYYDNSSSQGIDWTEDDTSGSWPHVGWVAVCDSSGASCQKYW